MTQLKIINKVIIFCELTNQIDEKEKKEKKRTLTREGRERECETEVMI